MYVFTVQKVSILVRMANVSHVLPSVLPVLEFRISVPRVSKALS